MAVPTPNVPLVDSRAILLAQSPKLILKRLSPMMFLLLGDIRLERINMGRANRKCSVTLLPMESGQSGLLTFNPFRRIPF